MPLGGYVKMLGQEDLDAGAVSEDPRSFSAKPAWARACVISAGVVMNLIFGLVFFIVAFSYGVKFPRPLVGDVMPAAPAALVYASGHDDDRAYRGLRVGDRVLAIDEKPVEDFMDVAAATLLARRDQHLHFAIERPGEPATLFYEIQPRVDPTSGLLSIGIDPPTTMTIAKLAEHGRLYKAGVRPDMTITAVAGQPVQAFHEYHRALTAAAGAPVQVTFTDPETGQSVTTPLAAMPRLDGDHDTPPNLIGLLPATDVAGFATYDDPERKSPAEKAGMKIDDLIAQVGDVAWPTPRELVKQVQQLAKQKTPVRIAVWRDGKIVDVDPIETEKKLIGIQPNMALDVPVIRGTLPGSPSAALNLNGGSRITSVNGVAVSNWADIQRNLKAAAADAAGEALTVSIGYELNIAGSPKGTDDVAIDRELAQVLADAGWDGPISAYAFLLDKKLIKAAGATEAVKLGLEKTVQFVVQTYVTIHRLFYGTVKITDLRGPVGIIHIGTQIAGERWTYMVFFFGLISVNLVVINFLPIPIVDGGLMVFLIVEKIKGSPVSPKILSAVNLAGLIMLGCLFLTLTYFDVVRWAGMN